MTVSKKLAAAALFLAVCSGFMFSQEASGETERPLSAGGRVIERVVVDGLKRTKPHVARRFLQKFIGRDASSLDFDEVRAAVMDSGILNPLDVAVIDDSGTGETVLYVLVAEKWSIFPIPFVMASSGSVAAGGAFMDANAFGLNDKMMLAGMYSNRGWMAAAMYMNTPDRAEIPGWNLAGFYGSSEREDKDRNEHVFRRFTFSSVSARAGVNYAPAGPFSLAFGVSFNRYYLSGSEQALNPPASGAWTIGFGPSLAIRDSSWDGYFLSARSLSVSYTYNYGVDTPSYHSSRLSFNIEKSIIPGFRMLLRSALLYEDGAGILFENSPASVQINILPRDFSARNYAGFSGGLEKYLARFSAGTLSILAAWEGVISEGPVLGRCWDQGVFASVRFYLSKIAIPALGMGYSYNISGKQGSFMFSLGMGF
ncbi:MAG: hypothetical protein LBI85_01235 [Spirochaetaceae bacterium]|jgi:hypothetical protein|nr:hypothetical protein [Spirochaetaceae bacterium]